MIKTLLTTIFLVLTVPLCFAQSGVVTVKANPKIDQLLQLKKTLEKENKLTDGFTIQLYYGERSSADATLKKYKLLNSTWPASIEYETPNYKVWVGNFSSRLDADRALIEVKKEFPSAFILKPSKKS